MDDANAWLWVCGKCISFRGGIVPSFPNAWPMGCFPPKINSRPSAAARTLLESFPEDRCPAGCRCCMNCLCLEHGGASCRVLERRTLQLWHVSLIEFSRNMDGLGNSSPMRLLADPLTCGSPGSPKVEYPPFESNSKSRFAMDIALVWGAKLLGPSPTATWAPSLSASLGDDDR